MSKRKYNSILQEIIKDVYACKDANIAKQLMFDFLASKNIEREDKKRMENDIQALPDNNINAVYKYITNSMFRFEGLSVNQY